MSWTITTGQARWNWASLTEAGLGFFCFHGKKGWINSTRDMHWTENSCTLKHAGTPSGVWHVLSQKWNDFTFLPTTMLIRAGPIYFQRIIRLNHRDCFPFLSFPLSAFNPNTDFYAGEYPIKIHHHNCSPSHASLQNRFCSFWFIVRLFITFMENTCVYNIVFYTVVQ